MTAEARLPRVALMLGECAGIGSETYARIPDAGQATKLRGFNRGMTVTAGLQTVSATPAHGTAFDIVGKGVATTTGVLETAIRLAAARAA